MSNTGNQFRTVAFGGFHKQDVLNYITTSSKEQQDRSADLQQQLDRVQQERDELAKKYESTEEARAKNAAECERLSEVLTERTTALDVTGRELADLKAAHEALSARLAELEARLPSLEEDAAAYNALKDRTATIELEAHRKAQETVEQAQAQAAKLRSEMESWLRRVQNGYQNLRTDILATASHLVGELERGKTALDSTLPAFLQHDAGLADLLNFEHTVNGPKAPEPLPLEEEIGTEAQDG